MNPKGPRTTVAARRGPPVCPRAPFYGISAVSQRHLILTACHPDGPHMTPHLQDSRQVPLAQGRRRIRALRRGPARSARERPAARATESTEDAETATERARGLCHLCDLCVLCGRRRPVRRSEHRTRRRVRARKISSLLSGIVPERGALFSIIYMGGMFPAGGGTCTDSPSFMESVRVPRQGDSRGVPRFRGHEPPSACSCPRPLTETAATGNDRLRA